MNNLILGIDIGGTNIKSGLVSEKGTITKLISSPTQEWIKSGDFVGHLIALIKSYNDDGIIGCGVAIPATLTLNDSSALFIPAIPCLEGLNLKGILEKEFLHLFIAIENDSNAAAFGEYRLRTEKVQNGMLLITLGTGVGCGLILDGKIFKGGNGNALELGEILSEKNERLEDIIGVKGIEKMANQANPDSIKTPLSVPDIIQMANSGDPFALNIMHIVGQKLGRAIVHMNWLFDVWNIVLGGGVSEAFTAINEGLEKNFGEQLPENIRKMINIEKAILGNDAGIIGIALRCFDETNMK